MTAAAFIVAAGFGAGVRFLVMVAIGGWPATLVVNLAGSGLLGWLVAGPVSSTTLAVVGVGFCGALTTFSTFVLEVADRSARSGVVIVVANVVGCIAAATVGALAA